MFTNRYIQYSSLTKILALSDPTCVSPSPLPGVSNQRNAFRIAQKNIANTNIHYWGGNLLALWEGGYVMCIFITKHSLCVSPRVMVGLQSDAVAGYHWVGVTHYLSL